MIRSIPSYRLVGQIKYVAIEECCLALLYCNFCFCVTKVGYRNKLICKNNNGSINFYDNFIKLLQIYHARIFQYKSESLIKHFKLQCKLLSWIYQKLCNLHLIKSVSKIRTKVNVAISWHQCSHHLYHNRQAQPQL